MAKNQRVWMVEVSTQRGWEAMPGRSYDIKQWALHGLKIARCQYTEQRNSKFRIAEYVRRKAGE